MGVWEKASIKILLRYYYFISHFYILQYYFNKLQIVDVKVTLYCKYIYDVTIFYLIAIERVLKKKRQKYFG